MIEILQFVFRDFVTWFGTLMLLSVICGGLGQIGNKNYSNKPKEDD